MILSGRSFASQWQMLSFIFMLFHVVAHSQNPSSSVGTQTKSKNGFVKELFSSSGIVLESIDTSCAPDLKYLKSEFFYDNRSKKVIESQVKFNTGCYEGNQSSLVTVAGHPTSKGGIGVEPTWKIQSPGNSIEFKNNFFRIELNEGGGPPLYKYYSYGNGRYLGKSYVDPVSIYGKQTLLVLVSDDFPANESMDTISVRIKLIQLKDYGADEVVDSIDVRIRDSSGSVCTHPQVLSADKADWDEVNKFAIVRAFFMCGDELGRVDANLEIQVPMNTPKLQLRLNPL